MSDTIIDDPNAQPADAVQDTLSEPRPPLRGDAPKKKGTSRRAIVLASLVGLVVVASAIVLGLWLFVFGYDAMARRHIPGNAHVAMRVDFPRVLLFGPVRDRLWPVITGEGNGPPPAGPTRLEKIRAATGVDLGRDPRELVVASTDGAAWVAVLGGRFEKGRFVQGLAKVARDEAWPGFHLEGEVLVGAGGVTIAQADDGAIVVGSNASIVSAALPQSDEYKRLDLADDAALSFAISREAWSGASGVGGGAFGSAALGRIERASGKLSLGDSPELTLRAEPMPGQPANEVARELETAIAALRVATLLVPDVAGEKSMLAGAKVTTAPDGAAVLVSAPWPYEGLDRGAARLATLLKLAR
jgi:hypothetical protein